MSDSTSTPEETTAPVEEKKEKRPRRNLNPENKPVPTPGQFKFHFNQSATRAEAVKRMTDAGFHMTYSSLTQRIRDYNEKKVGLKEMATQRKSSTAAEAVAADYAAEEARIAKMNAAPAKTDTPAEESPVVSENT